MTIKLGLHFHGDTDLGPAMERGWRTFTVLDLDRGLISGIMSRIPRAEWADVLIHVRQMAQLDMSQMDDASPQAKGREMAHIAWELHSVWPDVTFVFTPLNEPEIESGVDTEEEFHHCAWYCDKWGEAFHLEFQRFSGPDNSLGVKVLLGGRPSSPGHNEDGPGPNAWGSGYRILAPVWRKWYHLIVAHLYEPTPEGQSPFWHGLRIFRPFDYSMLTEGRPGDPGGLYEVAKELGMKILISEANLTNVGDPDAVSRIRTWLQAIDYYDDERLIIGIHWFIWTSPDPHFQTMQLPLRPALVDLWATWKQKEEPPVASVPTFQFGVLAEAIRLGADVVGFPLEDEYWFTDRRAFQATTKGMFVVNKFYGSYEVQFYPKA